jgi:hypothetical protein
MGAIRKVERHRQRPSHRGAARRFSAGATFVFLLWTCAMGCQANDPCAQTGVACGGSPVGQWTLSDSCQDPTVRVTLPRTYLGQPIETAGAHPPEPATSDWCADLEYTPSGIVALNLPHDTSRIIGAYVVYGEDHTYSAFVTQSAHTAIEFSLACLSRFGTFTGCADFGVAFATYGAGLGGVKDTECHDSANGCLCSYSVESDAAGSNLNGTWSTNGNLLTHFAGSMVLPSQADFCTNGDHLTLWGHNGTDIMDLSGVATMYLGRIVCGNNVVERGEQCDPPNTQTCDANCRTIMAN